MDEKKIRRKYNKKIQNSFAALLNILLLNFVVENATKCNFSLSYLK